MYVHFLASRHFQPLNTLDPRDRMKSLLHIPRRSAILAEREEADRIVCCMTPFYSFKNLTVVSMLEQFHISIQTVLALTFP